MYAKAVKYLLIIMYSISFFSCESEVKKDEIKQVWSIKIADSFVERHPGAVVYDSLFTKTNWNYEQGLILEALHQMYLHTGNEKYFEFIKGNMDQFINDEGEIKTYKKSDYNIDKINPGRSLLYLFQATGLEKYRLAADKLREQLEEQPRTPSGGYWHKKRYPNQMWLDGLYMGEPFNAEYSKLFNDYKDFDDISKQFILVEKNTRDSKTGLLYHAWDESKEQKWSNPETGTSPHFWGRAMGWYAMAIVDVLDFFPSDHSSRPTLIQILNNLAEALLKVQDKESKLWYQIVNLPEREGNYLESSASAMFAYSFAKGSNLGYLPASYLNEAKLIFEGLIKHKVSIDESGYVDLSGTCRSAGLGGDPYRDGSFQYYISEPQRLNDIKGYGPFLLTAIELERANTNTGKGINVALDYYYNNEIRKNKVTGKEERYHYTWEDTTNSGYYELGKLFEKSGAKISSSLKEPTISSLSEVNIFIIVDPDTPKETENPNFLIEPEIKTITNWVKEGGVLLLFANDKGNSEFEHLNNLAKKFGLYFNEVSLNPVLNKDYEMGRFVDLPIHPIFRGVNKIYMKEVSSISNENPQQTVLKKDNENIIVFKKFGDGAVLAISDPWLYNEYIDNRRLPNSFQNYTAAENLIKWILWISTLTP